MHTLLKVLGWLLLVPGGLLVVMIPFAAFDGNGGAVTGLVMLGGIFGVPGGLLLRGGIKRQREATPESRLMESSLQALTRPWPRSSRSSRRKATRIGTTKAKSAIQSPPPRASIASTSRSARVCSSGSRSRGKPRPRPVVLSLRWRVWAGGSAIARTSTGIPGSLGASTSSPVPWATSSVTMLDE